MAHDQSQRVYGGGLWPLTLRFHRRGKRVQFWFLRGHTPRTRKSCRRVTRTDHRRRRRLARFRADAAFAPALTAHPSWTRFWEARE